MCKKDRNLSLRNTMQKFKLMKRILVVERFSYFDKRSYGQMAPWQYMVRCEVVILRRLSIEGLKVQRR